MPQILDIRPNGECTLNVPTATGQVVSVPLGKLQPIACDILFGSEFAAGIPVPGSKEFCDSKDALRKVFEDIGDKFATYSDKLIDIVLTGDALKLNPSDLGGSTAANVIARVWNALVNTVAQFTRKIGEQIKTLWHSLSGVNSCIVPPDCQKAIKGVWALKQLIHLIESIRIGVDPAIWVTVDIHPNFDLISEWLSLMEAYYSQVEPPSAEDATEAWFQDRIDVSQRDCIWKLHGHNPESYETFALTRRERLDWREAVQFVRREKLPEAQEDAALRQWGFVTDLDINMAKEMYWELPGIADHLNWLRRNVFDDDYVRDYQLADGFDTKFWPKFGPDLTALGMREIYARYHYYAHWVMPSPEQMREFVFRSEEIAAATGKGFTPDDFERILAEQDYNPLARKWFKATIYNVPAISYVKAMYQQSVITLDELTEYHHRLGFAPKDAERFAAIDDLQKRRMRTAAYHGWTTAAATDAWVNGQMTDEEHIQAYKDLGYDSFEAIDAQRAAQAKVRGQVVKNSRSKALNTVISTIQTAVAVGVMTPQAAADNLKVFGWKGDVADTFATVLHQTALIKRVTTAVTFIRRHVLSGAIPFPVAEVELQQLGMTADAVQSNLATWRLQLTPGRKRRSAGQIVKDVAAGHMSTPEATVRLVNLGYDDADTRLYLADAQAALVKVEQARLKAAEKAGAARQKALLAASKQADKAKASIAAKMKRDMPDGKLASLAKKGLIGRDVFLYRMGVNGHTATAAELLYKEACAAKNAACVEVTPKLTPDFGAGGGGGPDGQGNAGGTGNVPGGGG